MLQRAVRGRAEQRLVSVDESVNRNVSCVLFEGYIGVMKRAIIVLVVSRMMNFHTHLQDKK